MSQQEASAPGSEMRATRECVVWLSEVGIRDASGLGADNASLGELMHKLAPEGISVPDGFALTTAAHRNFIQANALEAKFTTLIADHAAGINTWRQVGAAMRDQVLSGEIPPETARQVIGRYRVLGIRAGCDDPAVAVRSGTVAEGRPEPSLTGQQASQLNVQGEVALLNACKLCYASLFTDTGISHGGLMQLGRLAVGLSVGIQLMVRSDIGAAGIMSCMEVKSGFTRAAVIRANWGYAGSVMQGLVFPDTYVLYKPPLSSIDGPPAIEKSMGSKVCKLVAAPRGLGTEMVSTTVRERNVYVLDDAEIVRLGEWALEIDRHFGRPMNIEWAKDGASGELFVLQARPRYLQTR